MNRQRLVARYIELVTYAEKTFGWTKLPQIKAYMKDDEIVRLGKDLAERIKYAYARIEEHKKLLGQ